MKEGKYFQKFIEVLCVHICGAVLNLKIVIVVDCNRGGMKFREWIEVQTFYHVEGSKNCVQEGGTCKRKINICVYDIVRSGVV